MNKRIFSEAVEGRTPSSAQPAALTRGESRGAIPRTRRPGLHDHSSPDQAVEIKFAAQGRPEVEGRTPSSAQPAARARGDSRGAIPRTRRPGLHDDSSWSQNHA
jgi:hypothetical protein